jgi:hypothetical protein
MGSAQEPRRQYAARHSVFGRKRAGFLKVAADLKSSQLLKGKREEPV